MLAVSELASGSLISYASRILLKKKASLGRPLFFLWNASATERASAVVSVAAGYGKAGSGVR